jgi:hypothetical protein
MAARRPDAMGKASCVDAGFSQGLDGGRHCQAIELSLFSLFHDAPSGAFFVGARKPRSRDDQFFSRYPVLKIHATTPIESARKPSVIAMLVPTLTSPVP